MTVEVEHHHADIDRALASWRQGDCVLDDQWFVHRHPASPITDAGRAAAAERTDLAEGLVAGLVVLTQTCDIVRACAERPFIEVSPLVAVDRERLREVERGRRPAYAFIPELAGRALVADLDRVMTTEKPVVARWRRVPGWSTDVEARAFAAALARKRARFAFPDGFTALSGALLRRLTDKHGKDSAEGRALRALREIRVQAEPGWDAAATTLLFWFVRHDADVHFEGRAWSTLVEEWMRLVVPRAPFVAILGHITTLAELSAADYVASDPLDLDHLSLRP